MVPHQEFDRARKLLADELEKQYEGLTLVPPVELAPGYWKLPPLREITLILAEAKHYIYGVPGPGTGNLRIKLFWPYSTQALPFRNGINERSIQKAVKTAVDLSNNLFSSRYYAENMKEAYELSYIAGYKMVEDATEKEREYLWKFRQEVWFSNNAKWDKMHAAVQDFLELRSTEPGGILAWNPDVPENVKWNELKIILGDDRTYYTASHGVFDALDDWAVGNGLLENSMRLRD